MAVIRLGNLLWKDNTQPNSVSNPVNTKDVNSDAIKNKVDTLATETKLEQVRALLAGVATEDKLEQARALLQTISGKDFATQTTLAQVKSELELVKAELQAIKANQLSGDQKVQLSGTIGLIGSLTLGNLALGPGQIYSSTEEWEVDSSVRKIRCFIGQGSVTPTRKASIKVYVTHRVVQYQAVARELVYESTDKKHAWGFLFEPPFPSFGLEIMCVETGGSEMLLTNVRMWEVR